MNEMRKLMEAIEKIDEAKWNYPKGMKGKGARQQELDANPGAKNRKARKAFRKAQKAQAHAARMRGEIDENYGSENDFEDYLEPMHGPAYNPEYRELIDNLANIVQERCARGEAFDKAFKYVLMRYHSSDMVFDSGDVKRDLKFATKNCNPLDEKIIRENIGGTLSFEELCDYRNRPGIIILGAGGEISEWAEGISGLLVDKGISKTDQVFSEYGVITGNIAGDDGRTDAYFFFNENNDMDIGKLAIWRISFGDVSWINDFCDNYAKDYSAENDFDESIEIIGGNKLMEEDRNQEIAEELMAIKEEIKDLIRNAEIMLRGTNEYNEAKSYWIPHILMALDNDHDYLGGSMNSIEDTINALSADSDSSAPRHKRHFDDMSD